MCDFVGRGKADICLRLQKGKRGSDLCAGRGNEDRQRGLLLLLLLLLHLWLVAANLMRTGALSPESNDCSSKGRMCGGMLAQVQIEEEEEEEEEGEEEEEEEEEEEDALTCDCSHQEQENGTRILY